MSRGQERRRNLAQWLNEASPLKLLSAEEVTEPGWYCWRGREGEKKWVFIEFKHGLFTFENGLRFEPCPPFGQFIGPLPMEVMNVE